MLNNKNLWIVLIVSIIVVTVFGYLARAVTPQTISGYMVLMDQKVSSSEYSVLGVKNFESIIYLPSGEAEGTVTSCSFTFPLGVNEKADITKDGRIDAVDVYLLSKAWFCAQSNTTCWEEPFNVEECYFTYSDRQFKDPTRDCKIDQDDVDLIRKCWWNITNPLDPSCDKVECCRADVNKDGKVDVLDLGIIGINLNTYAGIYKDYRNIKKKDADLNGDGRIDGGDLGLIGKDYGQTATEQTCKTEPLEFVSGNRWRVRASGRGLFYVGVSFIAVPV
jgi:hypothetical protein